MYRALGDQLAAPSAVEAVRPTSPDDLFSPTGSPVSSPVARVSRFTRRYKNLSESKSLTDAKVASPVAGCSNNADNAVPLSQAATTQLPTEDPAATAKHRQRTSLRKALASAVESDDAGVLETLIIGIDSSDEFRQLTGSAIASSANDEAVSSSDRDRDGVTLLAKCVAKSSFACLQVLMAQPLVLADIDAAGPDGWTALHTACRVTCSALIQHSMVRALLDNGASIGAATSTGWTPLHVAVAAGNVDLAEFLISRNADASATAADGTTPLSLASSPEMKLALARPGSLTSVIKSDPSSMEQSRSTSATATTTTLMSTSSSTSCNATSSASSSLSSLPGNLAQGPAIRAAWLRVETRRSVVFRSRSRTKLYLAKLRKSSLDLYRSVTSKRPHVSIKLLDAGVRPCDLDAKQIIVTTGVSSLSRSESSSAGRCWKLCFETPGERDDWLQALASAARPPTNEVLHVYLRVSARGCCATAIVNGIPVTRIDGTKALHHGWHCIMVDELLLTGRNQITLLVNPGPRPSKQAVRYGELVLPQPGIVASVALCSGTRLDVANSAAVPIVRVQWRSDGKKRVHWPVSESASEWLHTVRFSNAPEPGPWLSHRILDLGDPGTSAEASQFLMTVLSALSSAAPDDVYERFFAQRSALLASARRHSMQEKEAEHNAFIVLVRQAQNTGFQPLSSIESDMRVVAGGRLIDCVAADGLPILRTRRHKHGIAYFPIMIGCDTTGAWRIVL